MIDDPWGFHHTVTIGLFDLVRSNVYPMHPEDSASYWSGRQDYRWLAERGGADDALGVAFGAERNSSHASISTGQGFDLGITSGFALARWRPLAPLTLTGAVRYDAPDAFAGQTTGRASAVLRLPAGLSLEGAWGQGFKVPTISEIACDFCFPAGPSTNLKPEHADGWDVAIVWASPDKRLYGRVTGYALDVREQIAFSQSFPFRYLNLAHTRSRGVEVDADAKLTPSLTLEAGYAYTDARDLAGGGELLRTPRNSGSLALFWAQGPWRATFALRGEGDDADIDPSTFIPTRRPGFTVATLAGGYVVRPGLELTARVDNVVDAHYQAVLGYGEPRLRVLIGLRAKG
jgi:outer membrane cobalamin receptor